MTSFVSKVLSIFGGKSAAEPSPAAESREAYQDVSIVARPLKEGSQYRIAGFIEKRVGESVMVRNFIRADVFTSEKEATEFTLRKARQIVDQHGASLFADGAPEGRV